MGEGDEPNEPSGFCIAARAASPRSTARSSCGVISRSSAEFCAEEAMPTGRAGASSIVARGIAGAALAGAGEGAEAAGGVAVGTVAGVVAGASGAGCDAAASIASVAIEMGKRAGVMLIAACGYFFSWAKRR